MMCTDTLFMYSIVNLSIFAFLLLLYGMIIAKINTLTDLKKEFYNEDLSDFVKGLFCI